MQQKTLKLLDFPNFLKNSKNKFLGIYNNLSEKSQLSSENNQKVDKLVLVYGNESADLDSCLGSCTLSYMYYIQDQKQGNNKSLYVPVLNCCKEDIDTKFEFSYLINKFKINTQNFVYKDSFDIQHLVQNYEKNQNDAQFSQFSLVLYDHNKPDNNLMSAKNYVKKIVDHHADETEQIFQENQLEEKIIQTIGSATSLLSLQLKKDQYLQDQILDIQENQIISEGIRDCIILDTYNFDEKLKVQRWNDQDLEAIEFIEQFLQQDQKERSRNEMMKFLGDLKFNTQMNQNLGARKLLLKDYKQFIYSNDQVNIGYSVITLKPEQFFEIKNYENDIQNFIQKNQLNGLFLLFVHPNENDKSRFEREFILISENSNIRDKIQQKLIENMQAIQKTYLDNFQIYKNDHFALYDKTGTFSRKLLEPLIRKTDF